MTEGRGKDPTRLVGLLSSLVSTCSLYSAEHPFAGEIAERLVSLVREGEGRETKVLLVEKDLVVDGRILHGAGIHGESLRKRMERRGVTGIVFSPTVRKEEVLSLASALSRPSGDFPDLEGVSVGRTTVGFVEEREGGESDGGESLLPHELKSEVREVLSAFSPFRKVALKGVEELVVNFILTFKREYSILRLLLPVRSYSEYTYTHAANVSILTIFQAQALGIGGKLLHEVGIAALLHDVGKLFIPREILEKKGRLTEEEFEVITGHTVQGAKYLSAIENLTPMASIVAYEHHMRFDGKGYPHGRKKRKKQNIVSQMVQIADFFDALRSRRPYKRSWGVEEILALMREGRGSEFNPLLVDVFSRELLRTIR